MDTKFCHVLRRFSKENFTKILAVVDTLEQIGEKHSATSGQVALAWLLAQGADVIPILGRHALKYARISNLLYQPETDRFLSNLFPPSIGYKGKRSISTSSIYHSGSLRNKEGS